MRPTSRNYGKGAVLDKPVCTGRMRHALGSKAALAEAGRVAVVGQTVPAAPMRVCSLYSMAGTLGLSSFWSNTGLFGRLPFCRKFSFRIEYRKALGLW